MEWEISAQKAVYTCTQCAWELVVEVGTYPEPFRFFEQHACANYVHPSRVHEAASYRDDASFVDGFARFIDAALKKGKPVIVITTEVHRGGIWRRLQARGWDIATSIQEGFTFRWTLATRYRHSWSMIGLMPLDSLNWQAISYGTRQRWLNQSLRGLRFAESARLSCGSKAMQRRQLNSKSFGTLSLDAMT
jgi:hypothetical protein